MSDSNKTRESFAANLVCGLLTLIGVIFFITQIANCSKVSNCVHKHPPSECVQLETRLRSQE